MELTTTIGAGIAALATSFVAGNVDRRLGHLTWAGQATWRLGFATLTALAAHPTAARALAALALKAWSQPFKATWEGLHPVASFAMTEAAQATSTVVLMCTFLGYWLGRRLLAIGLTGGIACGKSTVSQAMLTQFGVDKCCVVDADEVSRFVQRPGTALHDRLVAEFGTRAVTDEEGRLDRHKLARVVFGEGSDPGAVGRLNALTHPAIGVELFRRFLWEAVVNGKVVVLEAALLLRSPVLTWMCCPIVVVTCTPESQRRRLLARDEWMSADDAAARIVAQPSGEAMVRMAGWSAREAANDSTEAAMVLAVRAMVAQIVVEMGIW